MTAYNAGIDDCGFFGDLDREDVRRFRERGYT